MTSALLAVAAMAGYGRAVARVEVECVVVRSVRLVFDEYELNGPELVTAWLAPDGTVAVEMVPRAAPPSERDAMAALP